jgi:hypothetical protein
MPQVRFEPKVLVGDELSASRPDGFTTNARISDTHLVEKRAGLNTMEKWNFSTPLAVTIPTKLPCLSPRKFLVRKLVIMKVNGQWKSSNK